jgi:hypothetical protein
MWYGVVRGVFVGGEEGSGKWNWTVGREESGRRVSGTVGTVGFGCVFGGPGRSLV